MAADTKERDDVHVSKFRDYVPDVMVFHENGGWGRSCVCTGKISHTGNSSLLKEWKYTRDAAAKAGREAKLTMISPVWYHLRYKEGEAYPSSAYKSDTEYFADIAKAFRAELDILYDAGVRNIQIDDPNLACEPISFGKAHSRLLLQGHDRRLGRRLRQQMHPRRAV